VDDRIHPETRAGDRFADAGDQADDTLDAHYLGLERMHCCYSGWVFLGCVDDDGEERVYPVRCQRCESEGGAPPSC
jgi:hypothetical protein